MKKRYSWYSMLYCSWRAGFRASGGMQYTISSLMTRINRNAMSNLSDSIKVKVHEVIRLSTAFAPLSFYHHR